MGTHVCGCCKLRIYWILCWSKCLCCPVSVLPVISKIKFSEEWYYVSSKKNQFTTTTKLGENKCCRHCLRKGYNSRWQKSLANMILPNDLMWDCGPRDRTAAILHRLLCKNFSIVLMRSFSCLFARCLGWTLSQKEQLMSKGLIKRVSISGHGRGPKKV